MSDITAQLAEALEKLMPWTVSDFAAIPAYRKAEAVLAAYRAQPQPVVEEDVQRVLSRIYDLHKQATEERSHYYVGTTLQMAAALIERLSREKAEAIRALKEAPNEKIPV